MATGPRYSVPYKRKKQNKTNYRKRLALIKSEKHRLVIRKTNTRIIAQIIDFTETGDKTIVSVDSRELKNYGCNNVNNNLPYSYLVGYLIGKKALKKGIKEAVFDMGLNINSKGSKLYSVLMGVVRAGVKIPVNEKVFPVEDRVKGAHIKGFDTTIIEKVSKEIDKKVK